MAKLFFMDFCVLKLTTRIRLIPIYVLLIYNGFYQIVRQTQQLPTPTLISCLTFKNVRTFSTVYQPSHSGGYG